MNNEGGNNEWDDVFISSSLSTQQQQQDNSEFSNPLPLPSSSAATTLTINQQEEEEELKDLRVNTSLNTNNNNNIHLIGFHHDESTSTTLHDLMNNVGGGSMSVGIINGGGSSMSGGLKSKIKNKLKRNKKKGGVRFQDEVNNDSDSEDKDSSNASDDERSDVGSFNNHQRRRNKPSTPLPMQKQDTNEKGFTEVILPPLSENRTISTNLSSQSIGDITNMTNETSGVKEETPISKLMKGDTPHWLFILSFVVPTVVVCSILAAVQLGVCAYLFGEINSDPTFKKDPNALIWENNCTLVDISKDCAERGKYLDRGTYCYFDVKFPTLKNVSDPNFVSPIVELTTFLPYNMEETGIYFPMKVGDNVICYTNKKEDLVNIIEPISTRYEAYYVAGGILGVFGSMSVVAAVCVIPTAFVRPKNRIY